MLSMAYERGGGTNGTNRCEDTRTGDWSQGARVHPP